MTFSYSRYGLSKKEWALERALEITPAALSWSLLASLFFLCFFAPVAGVVAIILFDLYWLFRLVYFMFFLVLSYSLLEIERSAKWRDRLEELTHLKSAVARAEKKVDSPGTLLERIKASYSRKRHLGTLEQLTRTGIKIPNPKDIFHLVILPFYREGIQILESTLQALAHVNYPLDQMVVVLGVEERAGKEAQELARLLQKRFGELFFHFETVVHPKDLPGEAAVKGANATCAARWAKDFFEEKKISFQNVIVSCFDCDTVVSPEYFSCLTYNYLINPKRNRTSFQPIPVYHNNIWQAPRFACVIETGSSFMQLIEVTDPDQLVTFSSHSMSFEALVEIGYWPVDLISDDSAIFWKAFVAYDGDYRVVPLYVTLSMDVALGENFWKTCQSIYRQKRRWAWGVENFPILVRGLLQNKKIPLWHKVRQTLRLLEMSVSLATWTPIMLILSWVPAFLVTQEFALSVAHFNAPRVAGVIFNLALASLVISISLNFCLLPKHPQKLSWFQKFTLALQWLLLPLTATLFGAFPALDAQTRLALGHYLDFFVSPKGNLKRARVEEVAERV